MLLVLLIFIIVFAGATALLFAVHHQNRALPDQQACKELPREPVSLFAAAPDESDAGAKPSTLLQQASLIKRAEASDLSTLAEARGDAQFYNYVLNTLIETCERQGNLMALVRHLASSDDLRGNVRLAERVMAAWHAAPDRRSTVELLHIAALADDADIYHRAVDLALERFKQGRLASFTASDLFALIEGQYWVLATEARCGGAGFVLKQRLNDARRELNLTVSVK